MRDQVVISKEPLFHEGQDHFWKTVIDTMMDGLMVVNLEGIILSANQAMEQITGYSREELQRISWASTLTPEEWREPERIALEELDRTGRPVRYEKEYIRKDGTRVPIEVFVHLVRDERGRPLHYYSFITDLTERKKAEEALRRLAQFPEENPNPVLRIADSGALLYANAPARAWLAAMGAAALVHATDCACIAPLPNACGIPPLTGTMYTG